MQRVDCVIFFVFLLLANLPGIEASQSDSLIIEDFAGTGQAGYSGDGGPASQAQLNNPYGISRGPGRRAGASHAREFILATARPAEGGAGALSASVGTRPAQCAGRIDPGLARVESVTAAQGRVSGVFRPAGTRPAGEFPVRDRKGLAPKPGPGRRRRRGLQEFHARRGGWHHHSYGSGGPCRPGW